VAVVEEVAYAAAGSLGDFSGAFDGADSGVFRSDTYAFAEVFAGAGGVEGDEVSGAFADTLADVAGGPGGAFAEVAGAGTDVSAGAAGLFSRGGGLGLLRGCWGCRLGCGVGSLLLRVGGNRRGGEQGKDEGSGQGAHVTS
jgi:hypothetical protein